MEGRPLDERDLLERSRDGDVTAFETIVRAHQAMALRVAYLVVRDHAEAEDVTQEAFVRAYRGLGRFDLDRPFRPWLLRIVRNQALNKVRGRRRHETLALRAERELSVSGDATPSPETAAIHGERRRAVLGSLASLPHKQRAVIEHRYLLDLSEAETAAILGIPIGTVKSRAHRGLATLRHELGDVDFDYE